jgi:hypothetical protein
MDFQCHPPYSTYHTGPVHSDPCMYLYDYQSSYLIRIPSHLRPALRMIRWCEGGPLTPSGPIWTRPGSVAGWQGFHQVLVVPLQPRARVGSYRRQRTTIGLGGGGCRHTIFDRNPFLAHPRKIRCTYRMYSTVLYGVQYIQYLSCLCTIILIVSTQQLQ